MGDIYIPPVVSRADVLLHIMYRFELILPHSWRTARRPVYIHLAGTGDHVCIIIITCMFTV